MAVIKANAYGHGAGEVAHKIAHQVDWFAVNDIDEAIELRESGIKTPILDFGVPEIEMASLYKKHDVTSTISATEHFDILQSGTDYHLNFNTGMGRLGFRPEQVEEVLELMKNYPSLNCTGIYSHLATADDPDSDKPNEQYQLFRKIRKLFDDRLLTHFCNTAGAIRCREASFDMVRLGIGIYGYAPGKLHIPGLQPAVTWRTRLVQVNCIKKGETVSYGASWRAPEDGFIGIIPVGYCDGIPRGLSGNFEVRIDGKEYPVAGRVTMNYCMIFLGQTPLERGKEVTLLDDTYITAGDWAEKMNTIPYEILTGLPENIPRRY